MLAMGGQWDLDAKSVNFWLLFLPLFFIVCLPGISAVQSLAIQGLGTAIPLERLVTTGIYAYLNNPMQLSSALGWIIIGLFGKYLDCRGCIYGLGLLGVGTIMIC